MNEKQMIICKLETLKMACEENGLTLDETEILYENDPFMRGYSAAHRKIGAFVESILVLLDEE